MNFPKKGRSAAKQQQAALRAGPAGGRDKIPSFRELLAPSPDLGLGHEIEVKSKDTNSNNVLSFNGNLTKLTGMSQGVGQGQRVGDQVDLLGLQLHMNFRAASGQSDLCRILIVYYQDSDTAGIGVTNILDASVIGSVSGPLAQFNFPAIRQKDFAVLMDEMVSFTQLDFGRSGFGPHLKRSLRFPKGLGVQYDTAATTGVGHLYLVTVGTAAVATNNLVDSSVRVFYTDA